MRITESQYDIEYRVNNEEEDSYTNFQYPQRSYICCNYYAEIDV